jgi:hypothetical protein
MEEEQMVEIVIIMQQEELKQKEELLLKQVAQTQSLTEVSDKAAMDILPLMIMEEVVEAAGMVAEVSLYLVLVVEVLATSVV